MHDFAPRPTSRQCHLRARFIRALIGTKRAPRGLVPERVVGPVRSVLLLPLAGSRGSDCAVGAVVARSELPTDGAVEAFDPPIGPGDRRATGRLRSSSSRKPVAVSPDRCVRLPVGSAPTPITHVGLAFARTFLHGFGGSFRRKSPRNDPANGLFVLLHPETRTERRHAPSNQRTRIQIGRLSCGLATVGVKITAGGVARP